MRLLLLFLALFLPATSLAASAQETAPAALIYFQDQAKIGDPEAQFNLGRLYETGWGVPVDEKLAVRWYRESAKHGQKEAQFRLGLLYYLGIGARQSDIRGEKWLRASAKLGHPLAQLIMRKVFGDSVPDALNIKTSLQEVRKIYLQDESRAKMKLEQLLRQATLRDKQEQKAKEASTLRERRVQRAVVAASKPGFSAAKKIERIESEVPSFIGKSTLEENRTLSRGDIATIRVQAEDGLASAQYNLGRMYELGLRIAADKSKALEWYEKAAAQGYADAEYRLGIALLYGINVQQDEAAGNKWLALAARHGHSVAKKLVGTDAVSTVARQRDTSIAVKWYLERAIDGDAVAAESLGRIFEYGWGARKNLQEASNWYQRAVALGKGSAAESLQKIQLKLQQQPAEADETTLLLADLGLPMAWAKWLRQPLWWVVALSLFVWGLYRYFRSWRRVTRNQLALKNLHRAEGEPSSEVREI